MTAIEWLMNELFNNSGLKKEQGVTYVSPDLVAEAMQIEKLQIVSAYKCGKIEANFPPEQFTTGYRYYEEKYGNKGEAKE
jgi:hypothetical protein